VNEATDEREIVRKLVLTGHLSVPERKLLPGRAVKASLIRSVIEETLQSGSTFRAWWLPDDSMVGCEIEYRGTASGWVEHHYRGIEGERAGVREYENVAQAAAALLVEAQPFFGQAIDGVPIDWAN
jgi:hypothetical protein